MVLVASLPVAVGMAADSFFTPPDPPFVMTADEKKSAVAVSGGSAAAVQAQIDSARTAAGKAVVVVRISGTVSVTDTPLRLSSCTCLLLEPGAVIAATPATTAGSLVQAERAEYVAIAAGGGEPGTLDGQGLPITGIAVKECGRVNIDHLVIRGCRTTAVDYAGRDGDAVNDAGSLTRCRISGCGNGLMVTKTAGFICLDNHFHGNTGMAVAVKSPLSIVAGNEFVRNKTAILTASERGVVADNRCDENTTTLSLTKAATGNLVTGNRSRDKTGPIVIGGTGNLFFNNDLFAPVKALPGCENDLLMLNFRLRASGPVESLKVFQPPTASRPHKDALIVPGMGRFDLPVAGSPARQEPTDLAVVQAALDKARSEHPKDVIVVALSGHYVSRMPEGLCLPPNTCVLLNGTIRADPGTPRDPPYDKAAPLTQVVRLAKAGYSSFSGGHIDAGQQVFHAINATEGSSGLIDGVTMRGAVRDGISTKGRGDKSPLVIHGCTITASGGRGIWMHVAGSVHGIDNICLDNAQDGIDIDAVARDCTALFNVCAGNQRHGVFVEESATRNIVFGNRLVRNGFAGVHVWNEEVPGNTGLNVIAANECRENHYGISLGGRADDKTANENLFFNNVAATNRQRNINAGNGNAIRNYFSQTVLPPGVGPENQFKESDFFFSVPWPRQTAVKPASTHDE